MKLVEALRSGRYEQGRKYLRQGDRYCCLGVAANIAESKDPWVREGAVHSMGDSTQMLPERIRDEYGMYSYDGLRRDDKNITINNVNYRDLTHANDDGVSFAKIADYIEKNYQYL